MSSHLSVKAVLFVLLVHVWYSTAVVAMKAQHPPHGDWNLTGGMHGFSRKSSYVPTRHHQRIFKRFDFFKKWRIQMENENEPKGQFDGRPPRLSRPPDCHQSQCQRSSFQLAHSLPLDWRWILPVWWLLKGTSPIPLRSIKYRKTP